MKIVFSILCLFAFATSAKAANTEATLDAFTKMHFSMSYTYFVGYERQEFNITLDQVCFAAGIGDVARMTAVLRKQNVDQFFAEDLKISKAEYNKLVDKYADICFYKKN